MVVLCDCWQNRRKQEATLLLWLDWLIQGVLGLLVRCQGERLDRVPGVSLFWLLRRRDILANRHAARCSR